MKFVLIFGFFVLIIATNAISTTNDDSDQDKINQEEEISETSDPVTEQELQELTSETPEIEPASTFIEVRRRENCTYIYKPVYPVFCHPMAPRDEEGKCRKIVSLQILCGPVTKVDDEKRNCIPSPDNSEECFDMDSPIEAEK